jgi:hypothetical protein
MLTVIPGPALRSTPSGAEDWAGNVRLDPDTQSVWWDGEDRTHQERIREWQYRGGLLLAILPDGSSVTWTPVKAWMASRIGLPDTATVDDVFDAVQSVLLAY